MPDVADSANDTMELELNASLSLQRKQREKIAKDRREYEEKHAERGECLNCKEQIAVGTLYCPPLDAAAKKSECQQDHEARTSKRSQQSWA
jgi:hypothetical protein